MAARSPSDSVGACLTPLRRSTRSRWSFPSTKASTPCRPSWRSWPAFGTRGDPRRARVRGARDPARPRQRAGRLGRGDARARRAVSAGAPGLAHPQLRPARRHARRHGVVRRRLDRDDGRGRPARSGRHSRPCSTSRCASRRDVVYGEPTNDASARARSATSRPEAAKRLVRTSVGVDGAEASTATAWSSVRSVAASPPTPGPASTSTWRWAGSPARVATCPVELRAEGGRPSGYTLRAPCSRTSGGWCCRAGPGGCGWSACSA